VEFIKIIWYVKYHSFENTVFKNAHKHVVGNQKKPRGRSTRAQSQLGFLVSRGICYLKP
jgi:hypothetical protein